MDSEKKLQWRVAVKLLVVVVCAVLYAWGGMEFKWLRRFLAPTIACFAIFYFTKNWRALVQAPLMFASLSMGYGGVELWEKIGRRLLFGLANGVSSSAFSVYQGIVENKKKFLIAGFQIALLISAYVVFGVWNPFESARTEETVLGFLVFFLPVMSAEAEGVKSGKEI